MTEEPSRAGTIPDHWKKIQKRNIQGEIVAISGLKLSERRLGLIHPQTRVLKRNEIQEILVTDEEDVAPGGIVNNILYIGFFEVNVGGLAIANVDKVSIAGEVIGEIAGFNDVHETNHLNIVIRANQSFTNRVNLRGGDREVITTKFNEGDKVEIGKIE